MRQEEPQQEDHNGAEAEEVNAVEPQLLLPTDLTRPRSPSALSLPTAPSINSSDPPLVRRNGRLVEKKKANSEVDGVQWASRLLKMRFADDSMTHQSTGVAKEKLNALFSTALDTETIQAIRTLAGVGGKA